MKENKNIFKNKLHNTPNNVVFTTDLFLVYYSTE